MKTKVIIAFLGMFLSASAFADTLVKVSCKSSEGINKVSVVNYRHNGCGEYLIEDAKGKLEIGGAGSSNQFWMDQDGSTYMHGDDAPEGSVLNYCQGYGNVAMCRDDDNLSKFSHNQYTSSFVYNKLTEKYKPADCTFTEKEANFFEIQSLRLKARNAEGSVGVCG
ncbi:MAG: hypothetical protein ACKOX6_17905 [Bdellovibrio sp.]